MANITIDDVATLAGVSIKTVSRVVNKEPNVRQSTREKVEKAIKELDYRPNLSARSLAGRRSYLVALIYDNPSANYVIDVQSGVLSTCREQGYDLLIHPCNYRDSDISNELITLVKQTGVDGLILTPPLSDMSVLVDALIKEGVPFVRMAPAEHDENSLCVYCDDRQATTEMTEHLISLGHKRIGFITGHPDHGATVERLTGYKDALKKHGIKVSNNLIKQGYFDFESGEECANKMLTSKDRPTAIFASNDDMASGVIFAAHKLGLSIPQQLSVAGFDDTPMAKQIWPALTTVKQPIQEMAAQATNLLINQLRGRQVEKQEYALGCSLVVRQSTVECSEV